MGAYFALIKETRKSRPLRSKRGKWHLLHQYLVFLSTQPCRRNAEKRPTICQIRYPSICYSRIADVIVWLVLTGLASFLCSNFRTGHPLCRGGWIDIEIVNFGSRNLVSVVSRIAFIACQHLFSRGFLSRFPDLQQPAMRSPLSAR